MTDEELYRLYLAGDDAGLERLMERYGDALTLYIDGYLGDVHEAEDLMIEVFAYLLAKRPRIRPGAFKAYIYKAARHMALRCKSRRRAVFSLEELAEEPEAERLVEDAAGGRERARVLRECMARLKPDYREALYLPYFSGLSYAEAAEISRRRRAARAKLAVFASAAAGLAVIIAAAFAMPMLDGSAAIAGAEGAGSVFASGAAGYIVIGVLALALGVAVTLLGVKLRAYWRSEDGDDRDNR